jgi:hypothetical protein
LVDVLRDEQRDDADADDDNNMDEDDDDDNDNDDDDDDDDNDVDFGFEADIRSSPVIHHFYVCIGRWFMLLQFIFFSIQQCRLLIMQMLMQQEQVFSVIIFVQLI